jgi:CubicO group peptidase (beta-lactamase class C family)
LDPLVPNQVRYRAALHSEDSNHNLRVPGGQGYLRKFTVKAQHATFTRYSANTLNFEKRVRMRSLSLLLAMPVLSLTLSGCASSDHLDGTSKTVHDTLQTLAQRHHVCAVALAVIRDRKVDTVDAAAGCTPSMKPQADSVFQAASLSKPVFAYAVLKLVEQGKLALDAPVASYLPQGYRHQHDPLKAEPSDLVTDPRLQAITVRMVLNHTSGLPNWAGGPLQIDTPPGSKWRYSGEGYVLLQRAVEAVSGQPLDSFMRAQVFGPLGMQRSDYVRSDRVAPYLLSGTKANGAPRTGIEPENPNAAFSLYTTAGDYGIFLAALLNDRATLARVTASPVTADAELGLEWGLGWGMERGQDDSTIWQWGNNPGYRGFAIASVRTGNGFVMLTNSENGLKLAQPLTHKILPGERKVFRFSMIASDIVTSLCERLRVCI